jgi:hypothetical protein
MSLQQSNEIRDLTADELDAVTGGYFETWGARDFVLFGAALGGFIGGALTHLLNWLTGD